MNTVRALSCQTSWHWLFIALAGVFFSSAGVRAAPLPTPGAPPPPWQTELNTVRALEGSLSLSPAKDAAEERSRRERLATLYRQLAAKYPDVSPVQLAAGDGLASLDQPQAALPYWQRAAALDPRDADAAEALGDAYLRLGNVREACAQFQRAVDAQPNVSRYHTALANVQYTFRHELLAPPALPDEQAVLRAALDHFRRAAELSPSDLALARAYAETFFVFAKPDWEQALSAWQAVLTLSGEDRDFANSQLARICLRLGRGKDAEEYLAKIRSPAFDGIKVKLRLQIARLKASTPPKSP